MRGARGAPLPADVESQPAEGLYALVLREVESPLLREVLAWYGGNQSKAAAALGINRATLRKKLHAVRPRRLSRRRGRARTCPAAAVPARRPL